MLIKMLKKKNFLSFFHLHHIIVFYYHQCVGFWLTLNMLNCFKDYKRYIHISYHIFEFAQQKKTNFTMEQRYKLPVLHRQYHACWCSGDFRSQGISRYGVDPWSWNIPSPASEELMIYHYSSYFIIIFMSHNHHCLKLSETGGIYQFRT